MLPLFLQRSALLNSKNPEYRSFLGDFFTWQLRQEEKDLTSRALLGVSKKEARGEVRAKNAGVLAGREEIAWLLKKYAPNLHAKWHLQDGDEFFENRSLLSLYGNAHAILRFERIILNVLARLSGIASITTKLEKKLPEKVFLAATRKTLWGFMDKKAVAVGGGFTHRLSLADAVLIKENHLALLEKKVCTAVEKIAMLSQKSPDKLGAFWELEVENEKEFMDAAKMLLKNPLRLPGVIMLDNFSPSKIRRTLNKIPKAELHGARIFIEASGGITPKNITAYAASGADVLSSGFLTHSATAQDLSLRLESPKTRRVIS